MAWGIVGSIRGPQGPQGPQGTAGATGATGPTGPAGPSIFTVARKTANQTMNAASATAITNMAWALAANTTYLFYAAVAVGTVAGTSPTMTISFTGPASPTSVMLRRRQMITATTEALSVITSFTAFAAGAIVSNVFHVFHGVIVNGANAGTLQMLAAIGGTASPSAVVLAGSGGHVEQIS